MAGIMVKENNFHNLNKKSQIYKARQINFLTVLLLGICLSIAIFFARLLLILVITYLMTTPDQNKSSNYYKNDVFTEFAYEIFCSAISKSMNKT